MGAVGHPGEAEAIAPEHGAVLDDDPVPNLDPLAYRHVAVDRAVGADARAAGNGSVGVNDRPRSDADTFGDRNECAY